VFIAAGISVFSQAYGREKTVQYLAEMAAELSTPGALPGQKAELTERDHVCLTSPT
jgi:hypothetical protein